MRKRIFRISEDKFDDPKPNIEYSVEEIAEDCFAGDSFRGEFGLKSTNGVSLRGLVYSSNPLVTVSNPQFDDMEVKISYEIPNLKFKVKDKIEGYFTVVVFGQEKVIPFSFTYRYPSLMTSAGEITTLNEFANFAQAHFTEAVRVFYSEEFSLFVESLEEEVWRIYRGYRYAGVNPLNLEEFLVACQLKEKMTFDMEEKTDSFFGVTENVRGNIELARSTWGFIDIEVKCDAPFITVDRTRITSDFFLGSVFGMHYYVHKDRLHDGINLAKISFDYRNIHKEIHIVASVDQENAVKVRPVHDKNAIILELCRMYEQFRLKQISVENWCESTVKLLESLENYGVDENFLLLYKAQAFITNKQNQEALWIIQDLKRTIEDKRSTQWAYLLYLCTLIEREESYVDRITGDIESIFKAHSSDVRIFWFLLFLRREYVKNPTAKLRAISQWVMEGENTPFLLAEAYFVFLQDPYLISSFDDFSLRVLLWAKKHGALTKEMSLQMIHVIENAKTFSPKAFEILKECYRLYPDMQLLLSMTTYLVRGGVTDEKYFEWYKLSIEKGMHVPGVFEAYINSMPSCFRDRLPALVTKFFRYNNNLSYDRKALLYASVIMHKDEDSATYEEYERTIEKFVLEQLKAGRLDDNLAVCYQQFLSVGILDDAVAKNLSGFLFKKKLGCNIPGIQRVLVFSDEFAQPAVVPVKDGQAYVNCIGRPGVIFLEDREGRLIKDDSAYSLEEVMQPDGYIGRLRELSPYSMAFIVQDFAYKNSAADFADRDLKAVELFIHSSDIAYEYKAKLYPAIIDFMTARMQEEVLENHFLKEADLSSLPSAVLGRVVDLFAGCGRYDEAYYLMGSLNCMEAKPDALKLICHHRIKNSGFVLEDKLVSLCAYLVNKGAFTDTIIAYLVKYYVGPTSEMINICRKAFEQSLDVVEFSERIIMQSLYTDSITADCYDLFDAYIQRRANKMLVDAFLSRAAHNYLSFDEAVDERIFSYIFSRFVKERPINDSMRIALIKRLCLDDELSDREFKALDVLLAESLFKNQYFGFFQNMDRRLLVKYHLYDKLFVEYKGAPGKSVSMVFSHNGSEPVEEAMIEMYDGLYVKQFVLFFGDTFKVEVYCDELSEEPLLADEITVSDSIDSFGSGRYELMNVMKQNLMYYDEAALLDNMKKYQGLDLVTRSLFTTM